MTKITKTHEEQGQTLAEIAIFMGDVINQSAPNTPSGTYEIAPEGMNGLGAVLNSTGYDSLSYWEDELKKKSMI